MIAITVDVVAYYSTIVIDGRIVVYMANKYVLPLCANVQGKFVKERTIVIDPLAIRTIVGFVLMLGKETCNRRGTGCPAIRLGSMSNRRRNIA